LVVVGAALVVLLKTALAAEEVDPKKMALEVVEEGGGDLRRKA
jgi:hypothetical protein